MRNTQVEVVGCTVNGNRRSGVAITGERYSQEEAMYRGCQCRKVLEQEERKVRASKANLRIQCS